MNHLTKKFKKYRLSKKTRKNHKKYIGGQTKEPTNFNEKEKKEDKEDSREEDKKDSREEDKEDSREEYKKDDKEEDKKDDREGVLDIVENKVGEFASDTAQYVTDKGLRLFGLETIKHAKAEEHSDQQANTNTNDSNNNTLNKVGDAATGLLSTITSTVKDIGDDIKDVANKTAADAVGNVNEVLGSPQLNATVSEAAEDTSKIAENLLDQFNDKLNSPEMKRETEEVLDNIGDYAEITVKALNKPLDKAIDELNDAGTKALSGAVSGAIKVGTDAMAAVPYLGAIVELGKIVNDGSKAVGSVLEAGTDAVESVADLYSETAEGIKKGVKELEAKKKEADEIMERTQHSIQKFEKPFKNISSTPGMSKVPTGGSKTKKKLFKRRGKSKRVRFAI